MNIEQIAEQVARDFKMGFDGIELDFALEVAKRAAAAEREACAKVCETTGEFMAQRYGDGAECITTGEECAENIRARSNAEIRGAGTASAGLPGYTAGDNTE